MSEYYHEFKIGFNSWYLMVPLLMLLMFIIGTTRYRFNKRNRIVQTTQDDTYLLSVAAVISDVAIHVAIIAGSFAGIIQLILNSLSSNEIGWLPVVMAGVLSLSIVIFFFVFYTCGKLGEKAMYAFMRLVLRYTKKNKRRKTRLVREDQIKEDEMCEEIYADIRRILKSDDVVYFHYPSTSKPKKRFNFKIPRV